MSVHDEDAANAAAAWEAMNEQTANFQAFLKRRPTQQELLAKAQPDKYYDPITDQVLPKPKKEKKKEWYERY